MNSKKAPSNLKKKQERINTAKRQKYKFPTQIFREHDDDVKRRTWITEKETFVA
jgi:hypothetical protein